MENILILFEGEDELVLTREGLEILAESDPERVFSLFEQTAVYRDLLIDIRKDPELAARLEAGPEAIDPEREKAVTRGYESLIDELGHILSEDDLNLFIADVHNMINIVKV